jgi:transposase
MNTLNDKNIAEIMPTICQKYNQNVKVKDLAKEFDVSVAIIYKILHAGGIDIKPQGPQKLLSSQHELILQKYKERVSTVKIAKMLNVSRQAICDVLKKHNIKRNRCYKMYPAMHNKLIALHEQGHTIAMIAKKFNVSADTVQRVLKDPSIYPNYKPLNKGTSIRKKSKKRKFVSKKHYGDIIARVEAGENRDAIASEYGVSKMTIYNIVKRAKQSVEETVNVN